MSNERSGFSSRIGFVLATAGSAVGLGNIWRFPYLAAKYGGGSFLLVYLILTVTFGFTLMITEVALGRKSGTSAINAFGYFNKKYSFIGYLTSFIPFIIFPYYCVIGGWVTKFLLVSIKGQTHAAASDTFFTGFISQPAEPMICLLVFLAITTAVVILGVKGGIERVSTFMMPILVLLLVGISLFCITRPGAMEGVAYYLKPSIKHLGPTTFLAALGQLFYSMSLAMGIMITFGSYMPKKSDLEKSVSQVEIFDTGIAFLAGLMIVPSVFVFSNGDSSMLAKGPSLMFVMLPKVFDSMAFGNVLAAVFFILVFFAALTSAISLLETLVAVIMDKFHVKRMTACILMFIIACLMAIPSSFGFGIWSHITIMGFSFLDFFDFLSNSVLMPIAAFLTCIFVAYIIKPDVIINEVESSGEFKRKPLFLVMIKYLAPICIIAILVFSIMEGLGFITV
ncbi:sodium-dependent transporter [Anaerostipes faecalis]|uniref:sodium-dependent transporter n=1 Tax=Anaerostipes faecalis TaxID=2738446 RepID=UPI001C1E2764|nr:sodium-dependent transporter [Anaerostipes faecalis]